MNNNGLVVFGEVLYDCFPDGSRVLGGAPFNVAWHCQAFGLQPLFISSVGNDVLGDEIRTAMTDWGMDTRGLQLDLIHPTGVVNVHIENDEPTYDIVENSAWDFINYESIPEIDNQSVLYHGSLAMRNFTVANTLETLQKKFAKNIFMDINLRSPWWSLSVLKTMMRNIRWLKLNIDELTLIVPHENDIESRARYLLSHYQIELVVVTCGSDGALAISTDEILTVKPDRELNIVDTVGAGDAFSSIFLTGLHYEWSLSTILSRAQQFASAVVEQRGATTQDNTFYEPFINKWSM